MYVGRGGGGERENKRQSDERENIFISMGMATLISKEREDESV